MHEVYELTPKQLNMFLQATARRNGNELLTQMNISAASSSAAFTGNTKPLENIERALRGGRKTAESAAQETSRRLGGLARRLGATVK